jgi:hypothetical protein
MSETLLDKRGREIMRGDIVKVDHFIGARRKRYYMYKQCLGVTPRGRMEFSSLDFGAHTYTEALGSQRDDYEIVQSIIGDYESRPRISRAALEKTP